MIVFLRNFTGYQSSSLLYTYLIKQGSKQHNIKTKRSEPGTDYNTIGKITDVRVVRYDILYPSRTKQAAQQIITQTDLPKKKIRHAARIFF